MRVLHIVPAVFGEDGVVGGAERYAYELAKHMAREVSTTLVAFADQPRESTDGRLRVKVLGNAWLVRGDRGNPISRSLFAEIMKADIVHCHQHHVLASSLSALFCRLTRKPVFVSDLGGGGWDISGYLSTDRWFDGHLHISEYSRTVHDHSKQPWAHVILGGVDIEKFSPGPLDLHDGPTLFVGRLLPHKAVHVVIDAMSADDLLEIIGQPYDARYFAFLKDRAQGKRVTFRNGVTDDALVEAYRRALCVVLPSVHKTIYGVTTSVPELLGQTLLEGMACGCPAICSDVASMPEIIRDGVTGFIVPPDDPDSLRARLVWLRENPDEKRAMGAAARAAVLDRFVWPQVVARCLAIYASVSRGGPGA